MAKADLWEGTADTKPWINLCGRYVTALVLNPGVEQHQLDINDPIFLFLEDMLLRVAEHNAKSSLSLDQLTCKRHRVFQGAPSRGRQLYFTFPSAPDHAKYEKHPFLPY